MKLTRKHYGTAAAFVIAAWAGLFFSNQALLVWRSVDKEGVGERLVCSYFTGAGTVDREYLHVGSLGREVCPRWISLADR